jgi:hypothetical protein
MFVPGAAENNRKVWHRINEDEVWLLRLCHLVSALDLASELVVHVHIGG